MLQHMHDLFTEQDRLAINTTMAAGSRAQFDAMLLEQPRPSGGKRWITLIGLVLLAIVIGLILVAIIGGLGLIGLVILVLASVFLARTIARWWHIRSLRNASRLKVIGGYAESRGWQTVDQIALPATTPLLRNGDRRETGWGVQGTLGEQVHFCAGEYIFETRETSSDGNGNTTESWQQHPFTVAVIDATLEGIGSMRIHKGKTDGIWSKLTGMVTSLQPVPLESQEFNSSFQLLVSDDADQIAVRERFTPVIQVAFIDRGLGASQFEAENGVLVAAREGSPHTDNFGVLMDVLADAIWMRAVFADEPAGRLPDIDALRALLLGPNA